MRVEGKDGLGNIHDVLYLNSFYRKNEQDAKIASQPRPDFKPKLVSKQTDQKRTLDDIRNSKTEYENNLKAYQKAIEKHMGETMFKPQTGRAPKNRTATSEDIFDHLIQTGEKIKTKKQRIREREERKSRKDPKIDTHSVRMLELTK